MSEVNQWKKVRIGDALKLVNGRAFKPTEWKQSGLPIIRIQNLNNPAAPYNYYDGDLPEKFLVVPGDLLFAWSGTPGTSFGAHIWRHGRAWLNQHIFKVLFDENDFDKRFLQLAINQNLQEYIRQAHGGAGLAHITKGKFEASEIPRPPVVVQQEIVGEIDKQFSRLDESVTALKRIQSNLKRYKAAVLKAAVEGKLTEQWRRRGGLRPPSDPADGGTTGRMQCAPTETGADLLKRILAERRATWEAEELAKMKAKGIKPKDDSWKKKYKEPAGPDTANLPELPEGWVWSRSDQLFSFVTSGSRGWASYYSETGPVFLRMGNLDHDTILLDLTDIQRVQPPDGSEGLRTRVCAGDILVSITADVGMVGMVPEGFEEAYINQHVALARPLAAINSAFLAWYLASKVGQDKFKDLQRGATKVGLGLDDIKSVNVPIPSVKEQQAILEEIDHRLSVTEELEATIEANLKRAERLRQTILQRAFAGG